MRRLFTLLAFMILCTLDTTNTRAQSFDPEILVQEFRESIVKIEVVGTNNYEETVSEQGSGFVVFSNDRFSIIATAAHVVRDKDAWSLDEAGEPRLQITVSRRVPSGYEVLTDEAAVYGEHRAFRPETDWALIIVDRANLKSLSLNSSIDVAFGTDVLLLGFPSNSRQIEPLIGKAQEQDFERYGVRQPFSFDGGNPNPGHSGSAILDSDGAVLALASENYRGGGNRQVHIGVFSNFFAKVVSDIPGNGQVSDFEIKKCVDSKVDGQTTRGFAQRGSVRCPSGGCLFQSESCNRRETRLSFAAPSGYEIDTYEFIQESIKDGVTGNLRVISDRQDRVREISITLICDPSDRPGAGSGWNNGSLQGTLKFSNIERFRNRAEEECQIELAR